MLPPHIKALILDMDGVIWKTDEPIGDLASIFAQIRERGLGFAFATNNSLSTPARYVEKLKGFGVAIDPSQVVTSAIAVAELVAHKFPGGTQVFMIGGEGVQVALQEKGFELLSIEDAPQAQALVVGLDRRITFNKMVEAALLIRSGIPFYATNEDKTFPTPRGEIPGAGAWISVLTTATDIQPQYAGKPYPFMMELALEKLGTKAEETLVIGDRLETDIAAGQAVGCPTAAVLSGVSTRAQAVAWKPTIDLIAENLEALINS